MGIPLATYKADVLKGATISKGLMLNTWITYRYFRFPFLAIGNIPAGTWMFRYDYNVGKVDWSKVPVPPYSTN